MRKDNMILRSEVKQKRHDMTNTKTKIYMYQTKFRNERRRR